MYKELYLKIEKLLNEEMNEIMATETDANLKFKKLTDIYRLNKILENFDELEPTMQKFIEEKRNKKKWKER